MNPMLRADIDGKFDAASVGVLSDARRDRIRSAWWDVERADDISDVMAQTSTFDDEES